MGKEAPQIFGPERDAVLESTARVRTKNLGQSRRCTKTDFSITSGINIPMVDRGINRYLVLTGKVLLVATVVAGLALTAYFGCTGAITVFGSALPIVAKGLLISSPLVALIFARLFNMHKVTDKNTEDIVKFLGSSVFLVGAFFWVTLYRLFCN